ncbi:MAG: DUF4332 domain-containing protein [Mariniblastus sp.]|nr:DUF4332 domain-containing protein [Mariniblastus sp.]
MKLKDLAIEEFDGCQTLQLNHLSDGLNVIYGPTGSGKTRLQEYIRNTFFGFPKNHIANQGYLSVQLGARRANLSRTCNQSETLSFENLGDETFPQASTLDCIEKLGTNLYRSIYCLDSNSDCTTINTIVQQLRKRLNMTTGKPNSQMKVDSFSHHHEFQLRQEECNVIHKEIELLETERNRLLNQNDTLPTSLHQTLAEMNSEIDYATEQISKSNLQSIREQIAATDAQVTQVRSQLEIVTAAPQATSPTENDSPIQFSQLYAHLDELERQIRQQREIQKTVQQRRIELRDEMAAWTVFELNSPDHPYYKIGKLLRSLECRTAKLAENWNQQDRKPQPTGEDISTWSDTAKYCQAMQTELQQIGGELSQQCQHLRHRAATAELKHLRLQYNKLGKNRSDLINRRRILIEQLKQCDATTARAILQNDPAYQKCAAEMGHSVARRRFFGDPSSPLGPTQQLKRDRLRSRLNELQNLRQKLVLSLVDRENQLGPLKARLSELTASRKRIEANPRSGPDARMDKINARLRLLKNQRHLLSLYEAAGNDGDIQPDPILKRAGQLADRLTLGEVTAIWIHESKTSKHFQLITEGRHQSSIPYQSLSSTAQQQTILSLCLAAVESLHGLGFGLPMLINDIWTGLDAARVKATLELLSDYCRQGIQIITAASDPEVLSQALRRRITTFQIDPNLEMSNPIASIAEHPVITQTTVYADLSTPVTYPLVDYIPHKIESTGSSRTFHTPTGKSYRPPQPATSMERPNQDGAVLEFAPLVDESTPLINFDLFTPSSASSLLECGIRDVKDLLNHNPKQMDSSLTNHGFQAADLENWQSITWLMICVPGLRIQDASLLRSIGIAEPEQLFTTTILNLSERLQREINSNGDQYPHLNPGDYSAERLNRWYRALDRTQFRWQTSTGYSRSIRNQKTKRPSKYSQRVENHRKRGQNERADSKPSSVRRRQRPAQPAREPELSIANTFAERKAKKKKQTRTKQPVLNKFHLDLHDHVQAAPSIGPKTAERFQNVGVSTISEFLDRDAKSMAQEINHKRISASLIQTWQNQTILVCRIPNLRGHDAQLLVACGITAPEMLTDMSPEKLFDIVEPFSETKAGLKIIRSGKKPDLAEIANWIQWSNKNRLLNAA